MIRLNRVINPAVFFVGIIASVTGAQAEEDTSSFPEKHAPFIKKYCFECHDAFSEEGKVNLEDLPYQITDIKSAELWQKVLDAMNSGEMPPEDERQPKNQEKADFLSDLATTMVAARKSLSDSGGKITMRRLNRREYQNTIEHLTGITVDASILPSDGGAGTFDTVGSSQFISSDQIEQYLKLGRSAINELFEGQTEIKPEGKVFRIEPEKTINPANAKEIVAIKAIQARYTRWKAEVDKVTHTPENQAIIAKIQKKDRRIDHPIHFYRYADKFKGAPNAKDFGFVDSAKAFSNGPTQDRANLAYHKHYAALPHRDRGSYLKLAHGTGRVIVAPKKLPPGKYTLRVAAAPVDDSPASRHFIQVGHPQRQIASRNWGLEGPAISSHQVTGTIENPQVIEIPLEVGTDTIKEFAIQEKQPNTGNLKELWGAHNEWKAKNGYGHPPAIWIDWLELEGPLDSSDRASHNLDWVFSSETDPNESSRARKVFQQFAIKAFRGAHPKRDFVDRLVAIFEARRAKGDRFNVAIRLPLSVILASPGFLYLNEPSSEPKHRTLDDRELAVRLSYFLWSGPPDQELLALAKKKELSQAKVLRQQVDRLIADPRSDEFVSGFVHQWLDMERLDFFQFDTSLHREFDESTRSAARQEVYHSFAHLFRDPKEGRIGKLLKSEYVFINGLLATYYGIDGVIGDQFQKVTLPADSPRGGLLGMAAIHAMGSDGIKSSPVERGAWVLRHLLNDPPPPAPPNVPQISRLADKPLTTREKLAAHMEEAQCASCHRKIDPIGFGLENFDAAGKWRITDSHKTKTKNNWRIGKTWEIDPSGSFHKGPKFSSYQEMRNLIAGREKDFARGFTENLIEYALGRPFGFIDENLALEIMAAAKTRSYSVNEFIQALVLSESFHRK